ncbi:MAG TPA: peptidoglycan bridge formation glycyltransferase FemA/FemB family protein [Bacteroidales bacterium]|nr:peptidoglycan bridge formation glycyltransferase FemA/FemB family protein [Bacteroidales bacterium]
MKIVKSLAELNVEEKSFPIFFWESWLKLQGSNNFNSHLFFDDVFEIVIPFVIYNLRFLNKANYIYKPLKLDGTELNIEEEKNAIDTFHSFLKKSKICDVIFPPQHICNFKSIPTKVKYFSLGIIKLDISQDESMLLKNMRPNYRNEIKKAINSEIFYDFNLDYLDAFYSLYHETQIRQNLTYFEKTHFIEYSKRLSSNSLFGVAKTGNKLESGVFIYFDKHFAYYDSASNAKDSLYSGLNKALLFLAILHLKNLEVKCFILGGYRNPKRTDAKHNGIQNFKLRFGSYIEDGYHFIKVINPLKYHLFMLALKLKSIITGRDLGFINKSGLEFKKSK